MAPVVFRLNRPTSRLNDSSYFDVIINKVSKWMAKKEGNSCLPGDERWSNYRNEIDDYHIFHADDAMHIKLYIVFFVVLYVKAT